MKNDKLWFTLIELLIVIVIFWILALWIFNSSFNTTNDKQKLEIFTNKIISEIESVRTNALVWRWIWAELIIPDRWEIEIKRKESNWEAQVLIINYYINESQNQYSSITAQDWYEIHQIICDKYSNNLGLSEKAIIKLEKSSYSIKCAWYNKYNKLLIGIKYAGNEEYIEFNTINWLIERSKD